MAYTPSAHKAEVNRLTSEIDLSFRRLNWKTYLIQSALLFHLVVPNESIQYMFCTLSDTQRRKTECDDVGVWIWNQQRRWLGGQEAVAW